MNERIEKLALECYEAPEFDYKKFAELIVRDCIGVIEDSEGYSQYFPHVTENIEKHFGVEE